MLHHRAEERALDTCGGQEVAAQRDPGDCLDHKRLFLISLK